MGRQELDDESEWFLDRSTGRLLFIPSAGVRLEQLQTLRVEAPRLQVLVRVAGSASQPVVGVSMSGFNITGAAPTFMEDYEIPSGGDWSVTRRAAVFIEGATNITLSKLTFDQVEGNAVFLSNSVRFSAVVDCDFWRTGDSAVLAVGMTRGNNGTAAEYPAHNAIERNWMDTVG